MLFLKNCCKYCLLKIRSKDLHVPQKYLETAVCSINKAYIPKIDENLIKSKAVVDIKIVKEYEDINRKLSTNGFMIFNSEAIKEKIKQNPGQSISELTKVVADEWRALPYDKKLIYFQKAQEKTECKKSKLREIVRDLSVLELINLKIQLNERKKKKSEKNAKNRLKREQLRMGMPRPPLPAINLLLKDLKMPKIQFKQIGKVVGEKWKQLSEDEKMSYKTKARELYDEYLIKLHEWELKMISSGRNDLVSEKSKKKLIKNFELDKSKVAGEKKNKKKKI